MIDIDYLKQLLEIFDASSVNDLRIDKEETSIRLTKSVKQEESGHTTSHHLIHPASSIPVATEAVAQPAATVEATPATATNNGSPAVAPSNDHLHTVTSPIVGTFYSAPNPDADPFVKVGSEVSEGTVLCIVEAMKLMNEIESEVKGTVVEIFVENGQPVEYGTKLFTIELSSN